MIMITIENLTRKFGSLTAVDSVSFKVKKGEIVGLLGLNGAGKTTTMRMMAGALGPYGGSVNICGDDISTDPNSVKRHVGYLPEQPPLYKNMRVGEFLLFAATIKGVSQPRAAAESAMGRTGLSNMSNRVIETLSKGYRQRVGIAQALVHNPKVLILDEPASGLDPAGRAEIRDLIKQIANDNRAVILSTHLLWEVEAICSRVLILHQGKLAAKQDMSTLSVTRVAIEAGLNGLSEEKRAEVESLLLPLNQGVTPLCSTRGVIDLNPEANRAEIATLLAPHGLIEIRKVNLLQERFSAVTGADFGDKTLTKDGQ
tara:strand:+ start:110 stop:1051 length:942 start_codon:yes stop_codon:yes gene_type:complete